MIKKIITGIIITAFLILGGAGSIYAFQKEQVKMDTADADTENQLIPLVNSSWEDSAIQLKCNKNNKNYLAGENRYRHNNTFRKNEENNNCELEKNNYSWQYSYNHKNKDCSEDNRFEYNYRHNQTHQNSLVNNEDNFHQRQNHNNNSNNQ